MAKEALDLDVIDVCQRRSQGDQPGNGGPSEDCGLCQKEAIGRGTGAAPSNASKPQ